MLLFVFKNAKLMLCIIIYTYSVLLWTLLYIKLNCANKTFIGWWGSLCLYKQPS